MVMALKVQQAVDDQMRQVMGERLSLIGGLAAADAEGQNYIAQIGVVVRRAGCRSGGKAQHIGGSVAVTKPGIQGLHRVIAFQQHGGQRVSTRSGRLAQRGRRGAHHHRLNLRQGLPPGRILDLDLNHVPPRVPSAS